MNNFVSVGIALVLFGLAACAPKTQGLTEPPVVTAKLTGTPTTNSTTTTLPQSTTGPAATPDSDLPFKASINTLKANYLPGEAIQYGIAISDLPSDMTIDPFPPASQIKLVGQDGVVFSSPAGTRTQDIVADGMFYHTFGFWDQKDNNGNQVPPGRYELLYIYTLIAQNTSQKYTANLKAEFQIVPADSAINKNMDINKSVTASGITIILERLELNAVEGKMYVSTTPPGYSLPVGHPPEQLAESLAKSIIEYNFDGGATKQATYSQGVFNTSGVRLILTLDPVPVNGKELTIIITKLGDWEGNWEYRVYL